MPHGFAQQVMSVGDRFILKFFVTLADVGVYSMGVSFGLIQKIVPRRVRVRVGAVLLCDRRASPDAKRVFRTVTTYGVAVLALMTAGLSAIAPTC